MHYIHVNSLPITHSPQMTTRRGDQKYSNKMRKAINNRSLSVINHQERKSKEKTINGSISKGRNDRTRSEREGKERVLLPVPFPSLVRDLMNAILMRIENAQGISERRDRVKCATAVPGRQARSYSLFLH